MQRFCFVHVSGVGTCVCECCVSARVAVVLVVGGSGTRVTCRVA